MTTGTPPSDEYLSKIGHAMGCISFSDSDLDESLLEIRLELNRAFEASHIDPDEVDQEESRAAIAHAMALTAAIQNIADTSHMETLMATVGFLDDTDSQAVRIVKAVALDNILRVAIEIEGSSGNTSSAVETARLEQLRHQTAIVLQTYGYAGGGYNFQPPAEK